MLLLVICLSLSGVLCKVPPSVRILGDKEIDISEGDDLVLRCDARGDPQPTIRWVAVGRNGGTVGTGPQLSLTRLTRKSGIFIYYCEASNGVLPKARDEVFLRFRREPEILRFNMDTTYIGCFAEGYPMPSIAFYKIVQGFYYPLIEGNKYVLYADDKTEVTRRLVYLIQDWNTKKDNGVYVCRAHNELGNEQVTVNMTGTYTHWAKEVKLPDLTTKRKANYTS